MFFWDQTADDLSLVAYMFKAGEPCFLVFHTPSLPDRPKQQRPPLITSKQVRPESSFIIHSSLHFLFSPNIHQFSLSAAASAKQPCDSRLLSFSAALFSTALSSSVLAVSVSDSFGCFCGFFLYMRLTFSTPLPDQYP